MNDNKVAYELTSRTEGIVRTHIDTIPCEPCASSSGRTSASRKSDHDTTCAAESVALKY